MFVLKKIFIKDLKEVKIAPLDLFEEEDPVAEVKVEDAVELLKENNDNGF